MLGQFDILEYMSSMTGFVFDKPVLERIAMERGVGDVTSFEELSQRDRDLLLADLLFVIYTSPTQSASLTKQHGNFSQHIGSQTMTDKKNIYELMTKLYSKWSDEKIELVPELGTLSWVNE